MRRLFFALLLFWASAGYGVTLEYTLPNLNTGVMYAGTDSAGIVCGELGDSLRDLSTVRLWGYPLTGGGWRIIREKDVHGREGQEDTLNVELGWSYYVTALDFSGNQGCASNMVNLPGTVTGVDLQSILLGHGAVVEKHVFTVFGQLADGRSLASGIYFERVRYADGWMYTRRVLVLK